MKDAMENKDLINLFFQVLTLIGTMAGGFFTFWRFASSRIDKHFEKQRADFEQHKKDNADAILRVYQRMTEKCNELVPNEIYKLQLSHQKEMLDNRFQTMLEFYTIRLESLEKAINKLIQHEEQKEK